MHEKMSVWLEKRRPFWLIRYVEIAENQERFPHYAELGALARRSLFQREVHGLISFLIGDTEKLQSIQETHEIQAEQITSEIPLAEQLNFLSDRIDFVQQEIEGDPATQPFRGRILALLERASSYYRSKLRDFELDP